MSGFLHRLASRAQGAPSGIRAATRSAFAPAPALLEESPAATPLPPLSAHGIEAATPASTPTASPVEASSPPPVADRGDPRPPHALVPTPGSAVKSIGPAGRELFAPTEGRSTAGRRPSELPPPVPPATEAEAAPAGPPARRAASGPRRTPDVPPTLLPATSERATAMAALVPMAAVLKPLATQPAARGGDAIAEVHVSIGRVEIVAPVSPPKPAAAPEAPKPMSLEGYLARRSGAGDVR